MWRLSKTALVIIILMLIGIVSQVSSNPKNYIIPIVVIGGVFFLYKFPPHRWGQRSHSRKKELERKMKKAKFTVIQGHKKKNDNEEDDIPPYH